MSRIKLKAVSTESAQDCRNRTSLGPKALAWLRANVQSFRVMEAEAQRLLAEKAANAKENGR